MLSYAFGWKRTSSAARMTGRARKRAEEAEAAALSALAEANAVAEEIESEVRA